MAKIEDLIAHIPDERLRNGIAAEVKALKKTKKFGLVFEEHLPETLTLPKVPIRARDTVAQKNENANSLWRIREIKKGLAYCEPVGGNLHDKNNTSSSFPIDELVVVRRFGDPIYPALIPIDSIERGRPEDPCHVLINADNFHALQLLMYAYERKVDAIYIDPPYNTGARDWKYNNNYVDKNDGCQHSKWLSFMQRRLVLAKRLLKPTGVLIVTIDQNELFRLGVLLDEVFPEFEKTMVTITIHGRGNAGTNFDRVEEYAFFIVPRDSHLIQKRTLDSYNSQQAKESLIADTRTFVRTGNNSTPDKRPRMDYPIWVKTDDGSIRIGDIRVRGEPRSTKHIGKEVPIWPVDERGHERVWRRNSESARRALKEGLLTIRFHEKSKRWRARITNMKKETINHRTVWNDTSHAAKNHGTSLLTDILGAERFSFPKSLYAVRDCLAAATANNPDALILDFFAGSGTTLNAVNLLNANDGGHRRCVIVTNNEVSEAEAGRLTTEGHHPGDEEWERFGICNSVTWPRIKYTVNGKRDDSTELEGAYLTGLYEEQHAERSIRPLQFINSDVLSDDVKVKKIAREAFAHAIDFARSKIDLQDAFMVADGESTAVLFDAQKVDDFIEECSEYADELEIVYLPFESNKSFNDIKAKVIKGLPPLIKKLEIKRSMRDGFNSNVQYFRLDFLDPESVARGDAFQAILPILWLMAGQQGALELGKSSQSWFLPKTAPFAVLLKEKEFRGFREALNTRKDVRWVFLVTDSEENFAAMRRMLGTSYHAIQLYRSYLENFRINTAEALGKRGLF